MGEVRKGRQSPQLRGLRTLPGGISDDCLMVKPRSLCFPTEEKTLSVHVCFCLKNIAEYNPTQPHFSKKPKPSRCVVTA